MTFRRDPATPVEMVELLRAVKREQGDSGPVGRRGVFVQMCGAFAGGLLVLFDDVTPKVFSIREWGDVIDGEVAVGPRGALTPKEPST